MGQIGVVGCIGNPMVPVGSHALVRRGTVVYFGKLGDHGRNKVSPEVEDVEFDAIILHPTEPAKLQESVGRRDRDGGSAGVRVAPAE